MQHLKTYQLAVKLYKGVKAFSGPITYNEKDQLERAALSVVLNIAEACGKPTRKDRTRFLNIAMGSLRETQCLLELIEYPSLIPTADHLGALLYRFIRNHGAC